MLSVSRTAAGSSAGLLLAAALLPLAGLSSLAGFNGSASAAEPLAFTIPAEDGYGIEECLQTGGACGAAMAASWCKAHGHEKAVAYGAADVTGSTPGLSDGTDLSHAVMIRCGD